MLPDYRIRFSSAKTNFETEVGLTGCDHDNYPQPGGQARYDHMRLYLIGLLSQQASYDAPVEKRAGTPWFDLNTLSLKIWNGDEWVGYSSSIVVDESDDNVITLDAWYKSTQNILASLAPDVVFTGSCTIDGVNSITIPSSVQNSLYSDSRVFLYINGSLVNPHYCSLLGNPPTTIRLSNIELSNGDTFVVWMRRIDSTNFVNSSVTI